MAEFSSLNGYTVKDTTARNIAKGRNQAVAYSNYGAMVDALNAMDNAEFRTGQNIYIGTVGVPDLWVYTVEPVRNTFSYVSDEKIVELLQNNTTIQVGYYKLAMLEGQKVDLTNVNAAIAENASAIAENASAISEQNKNMGGLRFGKDGEGNCGYFGDDDVLIPFKNCDDVAMLTAGSSANNYNCAFAYTTNTEIFTEGNEPTGRTATTKVKKTGKYRVIVVANSRGGVSGFGYRIGGNSYTIKEINMAVVDAELSSGDTITVTTPSANSCFGSITAVVIKL